MPTVTIAQDRGVGRVVEVWRYPLKSAGGEQLRSVQTQPGGVVGDREWAVLDEDGMVVSAKHPARGGRLLQVRGSYSDVTAQTTVRIPGGPDVVAGTPEADEALTAFLRRAVHLSAEPARDTALRRWWPSQEDLVPEWEPTAVAGADATTRMAGPTLRHSFVDYGAVHVIFTDDVRRLEASSGREIEPARFRANVLVEGGSDFREATRMRIGELTFDVELPTPRCAVPGLSPIDGELDPQLLKSLAKHDRRQVGSLGTAACFGVYVVGETAGTVSVGDDVSIA
jgi:uncharacterized protein YcbX